MIFERNVNNLDEYKFSKFRIQWHWLFSVSKFSKEKFTYNDSEAFSKGIFSQCIYSTKWNNYKSIIETDFHTRGIRIIKWQMIYTSYVSELTGSFFTLKSLKICVFLPYNTSMIAWGIWDRYQQKHNASIVNLTNIL